MNLCRSCNEDFASVAAFDRHRTGVHAYTFREGLERGVEDGRRCMDADEMCETGMSVNAIGRWQIDADAERARRRFNTVRSLRGSTESDSEAQSVSEAA